MTQSKAKAIIRRIGGYTKLLTASADAGINPDPQLIGAYLRGVEKQVRRARMDSTARAVRRDSLRKELGL